MKINLLRAKEDDRQFLVDCEMGTLEDTDENRSFVEQDVNECLKDTRVILSGKDQIGMLTAYPVDDYWYIGEIYLIPEYRGKGIGRAIMQHEIDRHDKLLLRVAETNTHALDLYKSLGFEFTDEYEPIEDLIYMTKIN